MLRCPRSRTIWIVALALLLLSSGPGEAAPDEPAWQDPDSPENVYRHLGVEASYVGEQRHRLQYQIQSFIPPLYEPAFTESAYVLPPGALRAVVTFREAARIEEDDVAGQRRIGARFADFDLKRTFLDLDLFLGLDHNLTFRLNVPYSTTSLQAEMKPGFLEPVSVFPTASSAEVGDVGLFLKKKFLDQGNFPLGIAGVIGLRLPTGSNEEKFDARTAANIAGENTLLPLPAAAADGSIIPGSADGTFRRFSNDGRLPAPLQPGLGTYSGALGLFVTRQLEEYTLFGRSALHAGALYEIRPEKDGIDPGNRLTAFATVVKPLYLDKVSLDLTWFLQDQQDDSYAGKIVVPTAGGGPPAVVDRPPFSGGTTQFIGASLMVLPNPLLRFTLTGLFRVAEPDLGPSPSYVLGANLQTTFASGLFD